jgi:hypothetical protein
MRGRITYYIFWLSFYMYDRMTSYIFDNYFVPQNDLLHVSAIILYNIMTSYMFRPSFCTTAWPPACFGNHFVRQNDLLGNHFVRQNDLLHVLAMILYDRMTFYMFRPSVLCMIEWPPTCSDHHFVWQNDLHVSAIILYDRMTYMFRPSFCMCWLFLVLR